MKHPLRVAICAAGPGGRSAELLDPKDWERWGVNATWPLWRQPQTRFARWFELHRRAYLEWEHGEGDNEHFIWLRSLRQLPVYVQRIEEWKDVPTARPFPFDAVRCLAPEFADYHACSIDWMIACAIVLGAQEIALFGVEQDHTLEPHGSRACVEFWSGFAVARGIKVWSADGSTFKLAQVTYRDTAYALDPKWLPYGDETERGGAIKTKTEELARVVDGARSEDGLVQQRVQRPRAGGIRR